jgi:RNA binding exosome subunit
VLGESSLSSLLPQPEAVTSAGYFGDDIEVLAASLPTGLAESSGE